MNTVKTTTLKAFIRMIRIADKNNPASIKDRVFIRSAKDRRELECLVTNGHAALIERLDEPDLAEMLASKKLSIDHLGVKALTALVKQFPKRESFPYTMTPEGMTVIGGTQSVTLLYEQMDAPPIERVIPNYDECLEVGFNPELLHDLFLASQQTKKDFAVKLRIAVNEKNGPILVSIVGGGANQTALLMPVRLDVLGDKLAAMAKR